MSNIAKVSEKISKIKYRNDAALIDYHSAYNQYLKILKEHKISAKKNHWEWVICKNHFLYCYNHTMNITISYAIL